MRSTLLALAMLGTAAIPAADAPDAVVSAGWLGQHLKDRDIVILQVSRAAEFAKEHLPNARIIDPSGSANLEVSAMGTGESMNMNKLPTESELRGKLERLGISDGSHVIVAYGAPSVTMATRTVYLLRYAGVANVSLLDGGVAAWKRAGLPVTAATATVTPGHFGGHIQPAIAVDYAWVASHLHTPHVRIVDAREPVYYKSVGPEAGMAPGHIPGATNIPFNKLFDDNGLLRVRSDLEAAFRAAGVQPGDTIVAYCHVGLQATAVMLGARQLGIPARMYVGSFHDWSSRNLPIETTKP